MNIRVRKCMMNFISLELCPLLLERGFTRERFAFANRENKYINILPDQYRNAITPMCNKIVSVNPALNVTLGRFQLLYI